MSFKTANDIFFAIQSMVYADIPRGTNRNRINELFSGEPPYTAQEAIDNKIFANANFLEPRRALATAQLQYSQAFLKTPRYFDIGLDTGPKARRVEWGEKLSREINLILKREKRFTDVRKNQLKSAVLHGVGPAVWQKTKQWCPVARGIEDILVPSLTLVDKSNLPYFAVFTTYTMDELKRMTTGRFVDPGWNMPLVRGLERMMDKELGTVSGTAYWANWQFPEKVGQDFIENSAYLGIDAAPRLRCYDFYYRSTVIDKHGDEKEIWKRRILLDRVNQPFGALTDGSTGVDTNDFLFDPGDRAYANHIDQLLHVQFADCSVVTPPRWHNVRSLGYLMYAAGHILNRARNKAIDAFFESLNMYFTVNGTGEKERVQSFDLINYNIIPDGVTIIPESSRRQVNWPAVQQFIGGMRELIQEMSAVWGESSETTGSNQAPTATQIVADATNRNALVSATIADGMDDAETLYHQICERFSNSDHPDCKRFRERCIADGVDQSIVENTEGWIVRAQRAIGGGNKAIEMTMVNALAGIAPKLSPPAQQIISRLQAVVYSDDPNFADALVPEDEISVSNTTLIACLAWGSLMDLQPVALTDAINHQEYTAVLLGKWFTYIQNISVAAQQGQMPDMKTLQGLAFISQTIQTELQMISADKTQGQFVKQSSDMLAQGNNELRALGQRLAEAMKAQQQPQEDPRVAIEAAKARAEIQRADAEAQQTMMHREALFKQKLAQKQQTHVLDTAGKVAEMAQDNREHHVGMALDTASTLNDIALKRGSAQQEAAIAQQAP